MNDEIRWIATLSDGSTAVEHRGEYQIVEGERKPWIRLCEFAANNGFHLTSLRLNFRGRTIHLPRATFDKFKMNETNVAPDFYSFQYHIEVDDILGDMDTTEFVDLAAHYGELTVHYVQDVTDGNTAWVIVTTGDTPLAPSPAKQD